MSVIAFNFTKMSVEKTGEMKGKVNISNNISIADIKNAEINLGGASNVGLRFYFKFTSTYEPAVGKIHLEGDLISMQDKKVVDEILKGWKKDKSIPEDVMKSILSTVLNKCNVQALVLSKDLNLPSPIPLPKVDIKKNTAETKQEAKKQ
jgi:hypothetical protein